MDSGITASRPARKRGRLRASAAGLTLVLTGCVYVRTPETPARPTAAVDVSRFDYEKAAAPPAVEPEAIEGVPRARRIVFPAAPGASFPNVTAHAWTPAGDAPRASVLIFPILGGDYGLQEFFGRWLAGAGYAALWFERPREALEPPGDFGAVRDYLTDVVREARRALDWWEKEPGVDPERIGVLGTSMGSLVAALLLASEPRLQAGALLLAGADIPRAVAEADEEEIVAFRAGLASRGVAGDAVLAEGRRELAPVDPLRYAPALDPRKLLLVTGRLDAVAPYDGATALWEAAGRPRRLVFWAGHYSAIGYLRDIQKETLAHFDRLLRTREAGSN